MGPAQKWVPRTASAAYGRVYDYILLAHLLDPASREAEGPLGCVQYDLGRAFVRIEDKAIDHDVCILTERQRAIVVKGDLQACVSSRAKPVVHVHWRANDGGRGANLCRVCDLADNAYSGFSASTKGAASLCGTMATP